MAKSIDLNSDLGEHPNSDLDERIMPFLSSCNIACGGHAGDADSIRKAIDLAAQHGVAIGAHPSYPDVENFGRIVLQVDHEVLAKSLLQQVSLVKEICQEKKAVLHHVKPHGALFNEAAKDEALSNLICSVVKEVDPSLLLYGLAHSVSESVARHQGLHFVPEAFSDRQYEPDRTLRSRQQEGALLSKKEVLKQAEEIAVNQRVYAKDWVAIKAETICLHSDTEGAVNLAEKIRNHLESKGVQIAAV